MGGLLNNLYRWSPGRHLDDLLIERALELSGLKQKTAVVHAGLEAGEVLTHPLIIGELACGNLAARQTMLGLLHALPQAAEASTGEVLSLIARGRLYGIGLGVVDVLLLASMLLSDADLWTRDHSLAKTATRLRSR